MDCKAKGAPLTDKEKQRIQATMTALIRRRGEYDFDPADRLRVLAMQDLPAL